MSRSDLRWAPALALVLAAATACVASPVSGTPSPARGAEPAAAGAPNGAPAPAAPDGPLAPGPVSIIALGDSITAGAGDENGTGFVGRVLEAVEARRPGSSLTNLGQSGWDSTALIAGQDGAPGELPQAVEAAQATAPAAVLATVMIGYNDLWYLYQNGAENPTPAADEQAAVATYRGNLDRTVRELQAAGAVVVLGIPHDQSVNVLSQDIARLNQVLPDITQEEVGRMSAACQAFARTAAEVAAAHGVRTVDMSGPFWSDPSATAEDGHPNAAGYAAIAERWVQAVEPLL